MVSCVLAGAEGLEPSARGFGANVESSKNPDEHWVCGTLSVKRQTPETCILKPFLQFALPKYPVPRFRDDFIN